MAGIQQSVTTPTRLNVPGAAILTIDYLQAGQRAASVLTLLRDGTTIVSGVEGQAALNHWWATWRFAISSQVTCLGGTLRQAVPNGRVDDLAAPPTPAGAAAGTTGDIAALATVIKWKSTVGGRRGRGRSFIPGLRAPAVGTDGRTLTAAHQTAMNDAAVAWLTRPVAMGDARMAVLSRMDQSAHPVIQGTCSAVVGIQRRRNRA